MAERPDSATTTHSFHPTNIKANKASSVSTKMHVANECPEPDLRARIRPFASEPKPRHRPGRLGLIPGWLAEGKADSSAGSLGWALARSPGVRPRYDREHFGANVFLNTGGGEKCFGRAWRLNAAKMAAVRWRRWSGMSRLTLEEKAPIVVHVHSMVLGGWQRCLSATQAAATTQHNGPTAPTGADRKSAKKATRDRKQGFDFKINISRGHICKHKSFLLELRSLSWFKNSKKFGIYSHCKFP